MYREITIKETDETDLMNTMNLWNNGEVTKYVGFPNGLGYSEEDIRNWFKKNQEIKFFKHFSIYSEEFGYCGETGYGMPKNEDKILSLDIKLLPKAQGKGIAEYSLRFAIEQAIKDKAGKKVYVDPHMENLNAIKLYKKLGFIEKPYPDYLKNDDYPHSIYMELLLEEYRQAK